MNQINLMRYFCPCRSDCNLGDAISKVGGVRTTDCRMFCPIFKGACCSIPIHLPTAVGHTLS